MFYKINNFVHNISKDVIFLSSYWLEWAKDYEKDNKIDGNYNTDVCIVGAGIFGLTARILFI